MRSRILAFWIMTIPLCLPLSISAGEKELAAQLRAVDAGVIVRGKVRMQPLALMIGRDVEARLREANRADAEAWAKVKTKADWERFRDERMNALRASLGTFPPVPKDMKIRVTRTLEGDGYCIDNLVYETRPGLIVAANLYRPTNPGASMPGIVVSHSHGLVRSGGTRQDMGMTWARAGCVVLIPDHLGHGERRQHPFGEEAQADYFGRYDMGMQLHVAGESLMGWMAWDLIRGIDVLLAQKGVDAKRILLMSDPAGGGDIAAIAGTLDPRFTCVMVNNFGGPEPENPYPLARDAERSFDFAGSGSWESTRNLRLSARDGFLPWTILASCAPRRLIYYHEFYWDREQDPVWKRLQRVYDFYGASDALVGMAGRGFVVGEPPDNTHWIALSREIMYPLLERWFAIPNPKKEYSNRRPLEDLVCMTADAKKEMKPRPLHELIGEIGAKQIASAQKTASTPLRDRLRKDWARLLGDVDVTADPTMQGLPEESSKVGAVTLERIHLRTEPGVVVPMLLLVPPAKKTPMPVVIGVAQEGKQEFLRQRAETIAELLNAGVAVCLPDVRGTGESSPGEERGRRSAATNVSSSEWMLGQSLLGGRLRDVRAVLRYLRQRPELDAKRIAMWGDSFAAVNPPGKDLTTSHAAGKRPASSEPLGGLLALLAGLYEGDVRAVYVHGGLSDYQSLLEASQGHVPHDAIVPGVLSIGDLPLLAAAVAPRSLWLDTMVDAQNRPVPAPAMRARYATASAVFGTSKTPLRLGEAPATGDAVSRWFVQQLTR